MTPDFDPNKKLEDNLKKDGEFLRDLDKGHSPTETGLTLDLGIVRDEHTEVMDELGAVADAAAPDAEPAASPEDGEPPPPAPEPAPDQPVQGTPLPENPELPPLPPEVQAEHRQVMEELGQLEPPAAPEEPPDATDFSAVFPDPTDPFEGSRPQQAAPPRKDTPPVKGRFGDSPVQTDHARTFVEMGKVILDAKAKPEEPTPLTSSVPEMERLSFPREQNQAQVRGGLETVISEQAQWNSTVTDLFSEIAEMLRQHRLELDQVRGFLERIRL